MSEGNKHNNLCGYGNKQCNDDGDEFICQAAAEKAVKKVFAILGVDIDKPESVEEFRADLRFNKFLRKVFIHGLITAIGVAATAFILAMWSGFSYDLGKQIRSQEAEINKRNNESKG